VMTQGNKPTQPFQRKGFPNFIKCYTMLFFIFNYIKALPLEGLGRL
jgi:hypothetical protein